MDGKWLDISKLETKRKLVVLVAKTEIAGREYITDPWCGWLTDDGTFARWPHKFEPTHFIELPEFKS